MSRHAAAATHEPQTALLSMGAWQRFGAWFVLHASVISTYSSIRIAHFTLSKAADPDAFAICAQHALALIERSDPRAWRMVKREIAYLINTYLGSGGEYRRCQRSCSVDFERHYKMADPTAPSYEWYIAFLASTIVHEATHGRLYSLGIPYNKRTRARVERLCVIRQRQFLARLHSEHYDLMSLAPPFDAATWEPYWDRDIRRKKREELLARFQRDRKSR